ncbi:MAG: HD domain-containing phosphohydrolase [Planctomycetota bacterium]
MRILFAEDEPISRRSIERSLSAWGYDVLAVKDGEAARAAHGHGGFDVLISDWDMPKVSGLELVQGIRSSVEAPFIYIIMLTGREETSDIVEALDAGADDFLSKPVRVSELRARVRVGERMVRLERDLAEMNRDLEAKVRDRSAELLRSRDAVIFGLAKLAESRDSETGQHLERICAYTECLANELLGRLPGLDESWVHTLSSTAALHDIGKVGVPDNVLTKPGPLTDEERKTMQQHPRIGGDALLAIRKRWGETSFLTTAADIAIAHHECWDGSGYPHGLHGDAIPLAARVVAVADVYDALRSQRVYKPALSHDDATAAIRAGRGSQFDPDVVDAFEAVAGEFDAIAERLV